MKNFITRIKVRSLLLLANVLLDIALFLIVIESIKYTITVAACGLTGSLLLAIGAMHQSIGLMILAGFFFITGIVVTAICKDSGSL